MPAPLLPTVLEGLSGSATEDEVLYLLLGVVLLWVVLLGVI